MIKTKKCCRCKQFFPISTEYFNINRTIKDGFCSYCRICNKKYGREYYQKNKERALSYARKYYVGIDTNEYNFLLKKQNSKCLICGREEHIKNRSGKIKKLSVDHDHKTKKVRGLLCQECNLMISFANENPFILFKAIKFLKKNKLDEI